MRTVFNALETWAPEKKVGIQNKEQNKNVVIRIIENRVIINPEKFIGSVVTTFDPNESDDATKLTENYLKEHSLEMFSIILEKATISGLIKPADISLKDYLEL